MTTGTKAAIAGAALGLLAVGVAVPALVSGDARDITGTGAAAAAAGRPFVAQLLGGSEEVPNPGDPDGSGAASVTINTATGEVCWDIRVANLDTATLAHIHRGARGVPGPVVVDLMPPLPNPTSAGCILSTPVLASEIATNPGGFYVNVHTTAYPAGAVRGQLSAAAVTAGDVLMLNVPQRAYDSRVGSNPQRLNPNETATISLFMNTQGTSTNPPVIVPPGATAAMVRITATDTMGPGWLKVYSAALGTPPETASVNWYEANAIAGADSMVAVDGEGRIKVTAGVNATHYVIDVFGYLF